MVLMWISSDKYSCKRYFCKDRVWFTGRSNVRSRHGKDLAPAVGIDVQLSSF